MIHIFFIYKSINRTLNKQYRNQHIHATLKLKQHLLFYFQIQHHHKVKHKHNNIYLLHNIHTFIYINNIFPLAMQSQANKRESLLTTSTRGSQQPITNNKPGLDIILLLGFLTLLLVLLIISFVMFVVSTDDVVPSSVAIPWFKDKHIVMEVGTSRILQPILYSGNDNRTYNNYKQVTQRQTKWIVNPEGIITIDMYGRINAIKQGQCKLKLQSVPNQDANDQRTITVVKKRSDIDIVPKRVINFKAGAVNTVDNLQKFIKRMTSIQVIADPTVPLSVKNAVQHTSAQDLQKTILVKNINWTIFQYANGQPYQYVRRTDIDKNDTDKDKHQYFIGDRYLPDSGNSVVMIETDGDNGIWAVAKSGNVTLISMKKMSYRQKADMMVDETEKKIMRQGLASGAYWNGNKWIPEVSDNDGLWTSMYGAGELMKYASLKRYGASDAVIKKAREQALKPLKAVLFTANVAGRQGKVQAKIRHLNNTRVGNGVIYSHQYLLKGKQNHRDTYAGLPSDGNGFYGVDAGKTYGEDLVAGHYRYSMLPLNKQDWATSGDFATVQKNLEGFMSRTFVIPATGTEVPSGGLFFRRNSNGSHSVLSGAHTLYDYTDNDHPILQLGNKPIPEVLRSVMNVNGVQYNESDLVYKGDTSTDQVIGHLFIYKIAYDILDDNDRQQKQLKQSIRETMRNFCQHLINNGYTMVDATGQSTKWTKLYKQFFGSDYTIQDGSLKVIQLLMSFKVAYYVTGEKKWKDQYDLLTKDQKFRYIDMFKHVWDRWVWAFTKSDDSEAGMQKLDYSVNPSDVEIQRHVLYQFHFSDQQEAYLAYYLAIQLQQDPVLKAEYQKGMNAYWHSISKSQNPLWYFIYQLSSPDKPLNDSFGQDLRQVSAWQLSRHMVDTTQYQAIIKGARDDVIFQGPISVNPNVVVGKRTSKGDIKYVDNPQNRKVFQKFDPNNIYQVKVLPADERSIHKFNGATFDNIDRSHNPRSIQPSTTFTLPYWLGVYHEMIKMD